MSGPAGRLVSRVLDLDFSLEKGFTVTLDEVTPEEFSGLRTLATERNVFTESKQRR